MFEASAAPVAGVRFLEHPLPAGVAERPQLERAIRGIESPMRALVVSDPRSARILASDAPGLKIFDAYDAWDLSPLYRHRPRLVAAIKDGYRIAAAHADLVLANTTFMAERLASLGARRVEILPNGGPAHAPPAGPGPDVVYVGNIQDRLRVDLMWAAADAAEQHGGKLRIIGALQDEPDGWARLLAHSAVDFRGPRHGESLIGELATASVGIIPHAVDDYTRSQDAMKAWDYLARGLTVVSTGIPPAATVPDVAVIAHESSPFHAAVAEGIRLGDAGRADRLRVSRAHSWQRRVEALAAYLE